MTYSMSTAAARKASKKTQHVRSAGDWITLILLVAGALLVLFPLLVLTVNAFKTSADYNATGPLSLPHHFTMEGIISFCTTTNFPLNFWNSFILSLVVAVEAVVLSVRHSAAPFVLAPFKTTLPWPAAATLKRPSTATKRPSTGAKPTTSSTSCEPSREWK